MTEWLDVSATTPRIGYTATASQTAFTVPFVFFANSDLRVYQNDTLLTLDVDYTVTGAEDEDGGTVTLTTGATVGDAIQIARHVPIEQTTHIPPSGPLDVGAINIQISKLIAIEQQTDDLLVRSLRQPDSEETVDMELPLTRANKILGFDSDGAPVAVLGPSSVSDDFVGAAVVESKAVAQVTDFDVTTNYLLVGGTAAAGDAPLTAYIQGAGTGSFTDGGGTSWKPVPGSGSGGGYSLVTAVGDGVANDRAAIQATIDAVAAAGGGTVICTSGATYRIVINNGSYDGPVIKDGVTLDVNNATFHLECTGSVYGFRLQSNSHIVGPGLIKTTVSVGPGASAWWHSPVVIGAAYGEVTDVNAVGDYINASNWSVRGVTLDSVRTGAGGEILAGIGGISHGLIEDITIPDNSSVSIAIGLDHGTVGNLSAADIPASRVLFDAGLAYSVFPHDITIRRINIGNMTKTAGGGDGGFGIRLSGCYKITIDDVEVASSSYAGFYHTAGDFGFEFAPSNAIKRWKYRGTTVKNFHVYDALTGWGFVCEAYADNIAAAIALGYVNILPPINTTDILFEGCRTWTQTASTASNGFAFGSQIGGTMRNCFTFFHQYGVLVGAGCDRLTIDGGDFVDSYKDGIYVNDGTDPPQDTTIIGARCWSNGQDPGVTLYAGIRFDNCIRPTAERCILGESSSGEGSQDYGIRVTTSCVDAVLVGNNVLAVAASGKGYSLASAASYGTVKLFKDNVAGSGVATVVDGLAIIPVEYLQTPYGPYRRFITSRPSVMTITPPSGTWLAGDTVEFVDPINTGYSGSKCVTAGTPGTWKNYGQLT